MSETKPIILPKLCVPLSIPSKVLLSVHSNTLQANRCCELHCIARDMPSGISPDLEAVNVSPNPEDLEVVNASPKLDAVVINTNAINLTNMLSNHTPTYYIHDQILLIAIIYQ